MPKRGPFAPHSDLISAEAGIIVCRFRMSYEAFADVRRNFGLEILISKFYEFSKHFVEQRD